MDRGTEYPVRHVMPGGATVADWLGSASVAAGIAADRLRIVRNKPERNDATEVIGGAISSLEQALSEAREIQSAAAHVRAYGQTQ